jgi:hypothetical protein
VTIPDSNVVPTTIQVMRTVKVGQDAASESETPAEIIDVHKFATTPAAVRAGLCLRKSKQRADDTWVTGEISFTVEMPCYKEEVPEAGDAVYEEVKQRLYRELPDFLKALNALG